MKSLYSEDIAQRIYDHVKIGNWEKDAAMLVGIRPETLCVWKNKYPKFAQRLKEAELHCKACNIAFIQKAAEKTWQAAAWWLERKYSGEFVLKQVVVGDKEAPLNVNVNINYKREEIIKSIAQVYVISAKLNGGIKTDGQPIPTNTNQS